ncbi:MAG: Fic family protein [Magnetococcales bacterium]|nr:Fic family protein [Magnetococcales bacterium]NGZ28030.1 Fic family protein [Magnetococcales bacterium]
MNTSKTHYIWQLSDWPNMGYDLAALAKPLSDVSRAQGVLLGRLVDMGMPFQNQASLTALTEDVMKTSEIEGARLDVDSVRSSIARRLGVDIGALAPVDRNVEGVVEMVMDATSHCTDSLTAERLFGWHAALFPFGYSGRSKIQVARWRDDASGPMQVVSGAMHGQTVHYQAPPAERLEAEIAHFLTWANTPESDPMLIKAGLAHLWFVTLHPFEDGNGRIARAVGDLFLARADGCSQRFYSLSAQIQRERKAYYHVLEVTQKGTLDVTPWLDWFLAALLRAVESSQHTLDAILMKARFWNRHATIPLNQRQVKVLNRLLDGFQGNLTSSKWATIAKCSPDTALRDINELIIHGILLKMASGGRSTAYQLTDGGD